MDWSTVVAALAGGAIGVVAELSGRFSARRDAARDRAERKDEADQARLINLEDEQRRARVERAQRAVDQILQTFVDNPVRVVDIDDDVRPAAQTISFQLYVSKLMILDPELRRRLDKASDALDLVLSGAMPPYSMAEVAFIVRSNCYRWLGSYVRGDPLEADDADWANLEVALQGAIEAWHAELHKKGVNVHPRKYGEY